MALKKRDLLVYLAHAGEADAQDVARQFGVSYPVGAMALLRLLRQGLATRLRDTERKVYRYQLSERGRSRLTYLGGGRTEGDDHAPSGNMEPERKR